MDISQKIVTIAKRAKESSWQIAHATSKEKNEVIFSMIKSLRERKGALLEANRNDLEVAKKKGLPDYLRKRLVFNEEKISFRIQALTEIANLPDPVGNFEDSRELPSGIILKKLRVPIGVIAMIYESRPHVTVNAGALCLKSGNSVILKGGSETFYSNLCLGKFWQDSLEEVGLPREAIQVIPFTKHVAVNELLKLDEYIDLIIPRGGKNLIQMVSEKSRIPVIKHFSGVCHVYLDGGIALDRGIEIGLDSKCLMPEVCNAMETLLVCQSLWHDMPRIVEAFRKCGVTVKGCEKTRDAVPDLEPATEEDWRREYLDTIVSMRIVKNVEEAIEHINRYGSHHTEAIVTNNENHMRKFIQQVDSAVLLVNASTMFCDGKSLGMGAEIGISTDKLHARGPMGLKELTSYKLVISGEGHIMGSW